MYGFERRKEIIINHMPKLSSLKPKVQTADLKRGSSVIQRITGRKLKKIRNLIFQRDAYTCQGCGRVAFPRDLEVDHIVPLQAGGPDIDSNRQTLCIECHQIKTAEEVKQYGQ